MIIDGHTIDSNHPPYVIAEISGNHGGDLGLALEIMTAAKEVGADAIKLQTYTADSLTIDHDGPGFVVDLPLWKNRKLYEIYQEAHTPWEWHEALFAKGRELGITVFSSPFDDAAIELLESLGAPAYKIASFENVDTNLIAMAAATSKPLVISTGMANLAEITDAVDAARANGCKDLALLHCVSAYPAPFQEAHLANMAELARRFDVPVGLSDHTLGIALPVAATALGAQLIEKHVTLRRSDGAIDSAFSLEPDELATMIAQIKDVHQAVGTVAFGPKPSEVGSVTYRRSLYAVADIAAGEPLTPDNVRSIRPGLGLPPKHLGEIINRRAARDIRRGDPLQWDMIGD
ncbi:MAG TPA: pseudaminic acid synthase [Rhodospirillaceae bacterium]|nr:pseudaminic acid synthase [Magnetovibrio sp.]HCS70922.1 pseudaminic acid synthase [Rhodospirillaceae bacterium]|tara:strand:- start:230 stop:1270 length:1041 start_codon:yes stop_codon:yes gene_type:complete